MTAIEEWEELQKAIHAATAKDIIYFIIVILWIPAMTFGMVLAAGYGSYLSDQSAIERGKALRREAGGDGS